MTTVTKDATQHTTAIRSESYEAVDNSYIQLSIGVGVVASLMLTPVVGIPVFFIFLLVGYTSRQNAIRTHTECLDADEMFAGKHFSTEE
jgi:hypothetical protein